jgi:hypothetical protein
VAWRWRGGGVAVAWRWRGGGVAVPVAWRWRGIGDINVVVAKLRAKLSRQGVGVDWVW